MQSGYNLIVIGVLSFGFTYWQDQNSLPTVKISTQGKANTFQWNSIVPYTIAVSDAEDGKTEYNEIPSQEVVLVANIFKIQRSLKKFLLGSR